jgi:alpha-1,2-mannosyltransferase
VIDAPSHRIAPVLWIALALGIAAAVITSFVGLDPRDADVKYDWLSAKAALSSNAYEDVLTLGEREGVDLIVHYPTGAERPFPHPRTPGAILLSLPLLVIGYDNLFAVSVGITVGLAVLVVNTLTSSMPIRRRLIVFALLAASAPFVTTVRFAGQAMVVSAAVIAAWVFYRRGRDTAAGWLLAVAGVLKLFPLILVVPMLLQRRWKAAGITALAVVALTAVGLMLPGVGLEDAGGALTHGSEVWFSLLANGSIAGVMARSGLSRVGAEVVALAVGVVVSVYAVHRHRDRTMADPTIWLALALLVLPLSWVSYDLALIAALIQGVVTREPTRRLVNLGIWGLWIGMSLALLLGRQLESDHVIDMGPLTLLVRLLIVAAWFVGTIEWSVPASDAPAAVNRSRSPATS